MPVGKVFNAAENQVLISPVTSYYQGKAIRAAEKEAEQISELRGLQIDEKQADIENAPMDRMTAKKYAESQQEKIDLQISEAIRNNEVAELELNAKLLAPLLTDYAKEKDENKALDIFNAGIKSQLPNMSEASRNKYLEAAGADHLFDHKEIMLTGLGVRSFIDKAAPGTKVVGKNAALVDDSGQEIYKNEGGASDERSARYQQAIDGGLTPGTPEFNAFVLNQGGDSGRQRDDEIKDATELYIGQGLSPKEARIKAIKFVDDGKKILISQTDNTVYSYDKFTDSLKVEKPSDTRGPEPEIPYAQTLHGLADEATGIGPGAKSAAAKGLGPLGGYTANATTKAKAQFKASENALIEAFRLNPRYPQSEISRIQKNIDIMPKFWDSAEQMRSRMAGSRAYLENELASVEWNLENPAITAKRRGEEEATRDGIRRYLRVLGKPVDATAVEKRIAEIDARLAEIAAEREANAN